jgi:mannose-binding lectin
MPILYAVANPPNQQVTADTFMEIQGLQFNLPASSKARTVALVILSVTAPYAKGNNNPGINFSLTVDDIQVAVGGFTYEQKEPESFGRFPTSMMVQVPLKPTTQNVEARWSSVRGSTGMIDTLGYASLAAILG